MIRVALVGLGKMGLSHQAILNAHPDVDLVAVCDTTDYVLSILSKYTSVRTYTNYMKLLDNEKLDAIVIATPSKFHAQMVEAALIRGLHVFCEKPFCLDVEEGSRLADIAEKKAIVTQVGYHYRFVAAFHEAKRLLDRRVIGNIHHIRAEAYGPVVLHAKGGTWRSSKAQGGGCLYDYACHAIDLVNYLVGAPESVGGTVMNRLFSADVEDEVYSTLFFKDGLTGQIAANWSDESHRKMLTNIAVWGTNGRMNVDRQEIRVYLRDDSGVDQGFEKGWNVRYTTGLTEPVWYYLRGEEYSAQIDHFVRAIENSDVNTRSTFRTAAEVDRVAAAMLADASGKGVAGERKMASKTVGWRTTIRGIWSKSAHGESKLGA